MPVTSQDYDRATVLILQGEFTGDDQQTRLKEIIESAIENRHVADFIVDFSACPFVDSQGLESLVWLKQRCNEHFGHVRIINLDDSCRKILQLTRLEQQFEICSDLAAAMKHLR